MCKNVKGFTIMELMIVVTIIGVTAALVLPNFRIWKENSELGNAARELMTNINVAKMRAVKIGRNCVVGFDMQISGVQYNYVLFEDMDNDMEYDAGETIFNNDIGDTKWQNGNIKFDVSSGQSGTGLDITQNFQNQTVIAFRSNGLTTDVNGGLGGGTIFIINNQGRRLRVVVTAVGNMRIRRPDQLI
ncbi:MAG: GspH/FimT family pseudopilin [Desulfobacterales bacterium]|nr:GspH/FimT family pseudopilin [Desulfobacterales bacterium]